MEVVKVQDLVSAQKKKFLTSASNSSHLNFQFHKDKFFHTCGTPSFCIDKLLSLFTTMKLHLVTYKIQRSILQPTWY